MPIRWDSLLVRHLAAELDETLRGARLRALRLDGAARDLAFLFRDRTLLWRLHPQRGHVSVADPVEPDASDLRLRTRVRGVSAPPDERIVRVELLSERGSRGPFVLVVELIGNRWNALVTEGPERVIRHVLVRREGSRPQRVGQRYEPPRPTARLGAEEPVEQSTWLDRLGPVPREQRRAVLLRSFAWTSPINAQAILGTAATSDTTDALGAAFQRWRALALGEGARPVLLLDEGARQPYPFPLAGVSLQDVPSLLAGFARSAEAEDDYGTAPASLVLGPELLDRLEGAVRHEARRAARLRSELSEADDPATLRALGDLILARYADIPQGGDHAMLLDFDDTPVRVELDPALPPHGNADRYYDRAGRAERARARLPDLIARAERKLARLEELRARALAGEVEPDAVRRALPARPARRPGAPVGATLPYRSYRSSGGLEIRVGRGARHNDDLTFRHSAPGDVWMHARHASGAHVVLRWPGEGPPPARDLAEAANLAALHSKARTSGSVPVDWTFRRYVRKPRGSAPGSVVPDRVKTLFVEPDPEAAEGLADDGPAD